VASATVSVSRTSSPGPQIQSTTSLRRKERRKEAEKEATKDVARLAAAAKKEEPQEHLPVVGRKRKQKKWEKQVIEKPETMGDDKPEKTVDDKPESLVKIDNITKAEEPNTVAESSKDVPKEPARKKSDESPKKKAKDAKRKGKAKEEVSPPPPPPPGTVAEPPLPEPERPFEQQPPTPSQWDMKELLGPTYADMNSPGMKTLFAYLDKAPSSTVKSSSEDIKPVKLATVPNPPINPDMTLEMVRILKTGMPVRIHTKDKNQRMLMTPYGNVLPSLDQQEEERYLKLQNTLARNQCPHRHHNNHTHHDCGHHSEEEISAVWVLEQYVLKGGRLIKATPEYSSCGGFEAPASYNRKLRGDDAMQFVNQYVMPKLNLGLISTENLRDVPALVDVVFAMSDEMVCALFCMLHRHAAHAGDGFEGEATSKAETGNDKGGSEVKPFYPPCSCPDLHPFIRTLVDRGDEKTIRLLKTIFGPAVVDLEYARDGGKHSAAELMKALIPRTLDTIEKQLAEARKELEKREKALIKATKTTFQALFGDTGQRN
jgi:CCR4-NOT transcription complex subunit 4